MGITDIDISTELETNVPSIKYRGNEGPKSPQEEKMIMQQQMNEMDQIQNQEAGDEQMIMEMAGGENNRVRELLLKEETIGLSEMEKEELRALIKTISASRQQQMPRQMAAYGGIMGLDGRRQYGLGSSLKKFVRKVIPNEISEIAVKAAPFVAPFNPLLAAGMAGIGGFDQHGSISKGLKSGLMTYGMGQLGRGIGGGTGNLQTGINPFNSANLPGAGTGTFSKFFSNPLQGEGGLSNLLNKTKAPVDSLGVQVGDNAGFTKTANEGILKSLEGTPDYFPNIGGEVAKKQSTNLFSKAFTEMPGQIKNLLSKAGLGNNLVTGLLVGGLGAGALMGNMTEEEVMESNRGEGLDLQGIRTEVIEAMKDPSGEKLKAIRIKYPFLGNRDTKDMTGFAMGGRIGMAEGGIMDLGGMEKDYRAEGGFVPIGKEEKADDVPARLSVNEFVMTADAVRGMGDGDIDLGAKRMENLMGSMENKKGAQQMFQTSQRLGDIV